MWTTIFSVSVAGLAAFLIPLAVGTTVRRNDRRRAERDPLSRPDPTHVEVRFRTWQWVVWRVLGIALVAIGALFSLVSIAGAGTMDSPAPTIAAIAILLGGCGALLLASALRRGRIVTSPGALIVRRGFRQERTIPLSAIAAIRPLANAYGGLDARDANGRRLFTVMGLSRGYAECEQFLADRVVEPLRTAPAPTGPSGDPVPGWQGTGMSADWTMLVVGRGRPQPVVRMRTADGALALHLQDAQAVLRGTLAVAESIWTPEAYLCSPASASPGSPAATALAGVPADAMALLVGDLPRPAAVLQGGELESFRGWVDRLPSAADAAGRPAT